MKNDVEGFELDVFEGGKQVIGDFKPNAFLEMNHWFLNVFRRISIPEFRERQMAVFPVVYALHGSEYLDYTDNANVHTINHSHVVQHKYNNLVAGFDRDEIIAKLEALKTAPRFLSLPPPPSQLDLIKHELFAMQRSLPKRGRIYLKSARKWTLPLANIPKLSLVLSEKSSREPKKRTD